MKRLFNVQCVMFNLVLFYTLHFTHYAAFAQPVSSAELINHAKRFDGQVVVYTGEVIGDIMVRGQYAWVNVNDGQNAIGIWASKDLIKGIVYTGSYKFRGDTIEVSGVFHRACLQHGGDLDLHAESVVRKINGGPTQQAFDLDQRNTVILLSCALGIIWILTLLKRR